MSVTKEKLDEIANDYHTKEVPDKFIENAGQIYSLNWINQQLLDCKTILELGYGDGIITTNLLKQNKILTQLEGSSVLVEKVKNLYGDKINCIHTLFEEFEPTERYDAVIASHVLEHVDNPVELLKKMATWIKPTGKILIIVPNKESIHRQLAVLMGLQKELDTLSPRDYIVGHQRVYSIDTLLKDIMDSKLEYHSMRGFGFKPLPNSMMLDFSPELIKAMNTISNYIPITMSANLGLVVTK